MISSEELERAEKALQLIYGVSPTSMERQLAHINVDREAFEQWHQHRISSAVRHYWASYKRMDPRLEAAYNTLLMHFFLVGIICGREEAKRLM